MPRSTGNHTGIRPTYQSDFKWNQISIEVIGRNCLDFPPEKSCIQPQPTGFIVEARREPNLGPFNPQGCVMIDVQEIAQLHQKTVSDWHEQDISNPYPGLLGLVCDQHSFNFRLWHQEDIARSPEVDDTEIAAVKRRIDKLNQQRNDWIEKVDDFLTQIVFERNIEPKAEAPINTETPGSVIDRLSIMQLRIYHMQEQLDRSDASSEHIESVTQKMTLCQIQQNELQEALQQLLNNIAAGKVRHRTYRQMKMYNDPSLNPYLYQSQKTTVPAEAEPLPRAA